MKNTYTLTRQSIEFRAKDINAVTPGCTISDSDPEIIATFESKEDAYAALAQHESDVRFFPYHSMRYAAVTEWWVWDEEWQSADHTTFTDTVFDGGTEYKYIDGAFPRWEEVDE